MTTTSSSSAAAVRPFYWSVRRELWEHRAAYIAPLAAAGLVLLGYLLAHVPGSHVRMQMSDGPSEAFAQALPYIVVAGVVLITSLIVSFAYCLSALNAERRDRSILYWKSLPVSDLTTVLSKAAMPMLVIPVIAFAVILAADIITLGIMSIGGVTDGVAPRTIVGSVFWGPLVLSLWYAPIFGWLLVVSSWAKRGGFLWAILPPLAVCVLEGIIFHTHRFADLLGLRLNGGFAAAFEMSDIVKPGDIRLPHVTREQFFTSPDLWVGLLAAVAFLAVAVWRRRRAEPV